MAIVDTGQNAFEPYPTNGYDYSGSLVPWAATGSLYVTTNTCYLNGALGTLSLYYDPATGFYSLNTPGGPWDTFDRTAKKKGTATGSIPETTQELTEVLNFGLGDLNIEDVRLGQTKLGQFNGVTADWAVLTNDGHYFVTAHPNPPYGAATAWKLNVISVEGGELRQNSGVADSGWIKRDFYGTDCEFIQVDISGRLYYSGNSGPEAATCDFEIAYRVPGGAWSTVATPSFTNSDAFPVRETIGWAVPLGSQYEVRVRKVTTDSTDARLTQDFQFYQVKFFRPEPIEADNPFTQHPAQIRGVIAIRAGGQLNGVIDNLNAYCHAKCWVWTGGTSVSPTPVGGAGWVWQNTENPAWWYLYYAMGGYRRSAADPGSPLNGKGWCCGPEKADGPRMFGAGLAQVNVDLDSLSAWAAFCDSYNLRFNAVIREQSNVGDVLSKIARIGRASPTWQFGKLGVVWEDPTDVPIATFGMNSIRRDTLSITYIGYNTPDEIVATYVNTNDEWRENEVRKVVPGTVLPNSETHIALWGCKYKDQAQREVNLLAARQFYQRRRVTFQTDQEGLPILRGDVILLAHDMTDWAYSSRVADGTAGSTLKLVRAIDPLPGASFNITVVKPDGTSLSGTGAMPTSATDTIQLSGGWAPVDFSEFPDAVPEDWVVYLSTNADVGKRMRVVGVEQGDGRNIKITCTDERPEMWLYENGGTPSNLGDSGEKLIAKAFDVFATRDTCSGAVHVEWSLLNCRGAIVTVNGGSVNVWGNKFTYATLPANTSLSISVMPLLDPGAPAVASTGDSWSGVV